MQSAGAAWAGGIVIGAALAAVITTVVVAVVMNIDSVQAIAVVLRGISIGNATCAIHTFRRVWMAWQGAANHPTFLELLGPKWVGIGTRPREGHSLHDHCGRVYWGLFLTQFFTRRMKRAAWPPIAPSPAQSPPLSCTVILFIIFTALGPIGAIIQSIIGVLNAIASLICSALPQDMQSGRVGPGAMRWRHRIPHLVDPAADLQWDDPG